jgi:hypothetical protein
MAENIKSASSRRGWIVLLIALLVVFGVLFAKSFQPQYVHHSNDGPLGAISAQTEYVLGNLAAYWQNLNWLGGHQPSSMPTVDLLFFVLTGPISFAKFIVPVSLLVLGLAACLFLRQLKFAWPVCVLGGIAAALNGNSFSNACWGQYSRPLTQAIVFLALVAIQSQFRHPLIKLLLAGSAVGMGIMHGFDVGALYSLYVAAFAVMFYLVHSTRSMPAKVAVGAGQVAIIAIAAAVIAAHALTSLIGTQIQGVVGTEQTEEAKARRWSEATQWSTPKMETLRVIIPGLHGYRMDTGDGGQYWGQVGQSEGWPETRQGIARFSGSGEYAGVLVVLMAIYAIVQAFRKQGSAFTPEEKKMVLFWGALALLSLMLSWGRFFAVLYKIVYALPYFSTIRNPMKFMHPFHLILVILFGYGLQALWRRYVETVIPRSSSFSEQWKRFWSTATQPDRRWAMACVAIVILSALSWLVCSSAVKGIEKHLTDFAGLDAGLAAVTAKFTLREVGLFAFFTVLSVGAVLAIMSGWFSGQRGKTAGILLGLLLVVDLARANRPWIVYNDYKDKYATNPVIEKLRENPHNSRVTFFAMALPQNDLFSQLYGIEWLQHHFQYYRIQSIDIIQMPREPIDYAAFSGMNGAFPYRNGFMMPDKHSILTRYWELTNTRYILGPGNLADGLNANIDKELKRFRTVMKFDVAPKPDRSDVKKLEDLTVVENPNGKYALVEFTGALPRAGSYSNWTTNTIDQATLAELQKPEFDPHKNVIVAEPLSAPSQTPTPAAGKVEIVKYEPKRIELTADASAASVLMLNDKYDSNWRVSVDGKSEPLLRANFIMRGVQLQPGNHRVVFEFKPPVTALYVTLGAIGLTALLCAFVIVSGRRDQPVALEEKPRA